MTDCNCDQRYVYHPAGLSGDSNYFSEAIKLFRLYLGTGYLNADRVLSLLNGCPQSALYTAITNEPAGQLLSTVAGFATVDDMLQ